MSQSSRRILFNFASLSGAEILIRVLQSVLFIYIGRELGNSPLGQLSTALALVNFFNIFADFGLTILGVREIAKDKDNTNQIGTTIAAIQTSLAIVMVVALSIFLIFAPLPTEIKWMTWSLGLMMIPMAMNLSYIFQAYEKMHFASIARIITQSAYIIPGFIVVWLTGSVFYLPILYTAAAILGSLYTYTLLRRKLQFRLTSFSLDQAKHLLRQSIPFAVSALMVQIFYNSGSIFIQFITGEGDVGLFQAGFKIVMLLITFSAFLGTALFPLMSYKSKQDGIASLEPTLAKVYRLLGLAVIPASAMGIILSQDILLLLYKQPQYAEAAPSFAWLWALVAIIVFNQLLGNMLLAAGWQKLATISVVAAAIVNLIGNAILIPWLGLVGASVSIVLAEIANIVSMQWGLRKTMGLRLLRTYLLPPLIPTAITVAIYYGLVHVTGWVWHSAIVSGIVYPALVIGLKIVNVREAKSILSLVRKSKEGTETTAI